MNGPTAPPPEVPQPRTAPVTAPVPWAVGQTGAGARKGITDEAAGPRVTQRNRRIAEGLPDWEPLPPGEIVVRRPGGPA